MGTISLKGAEFFARHGYYDSERSEGNTFEVDVLMEVSLETAGKSDVLDRTVDYQKVYEVVSEVMEGEPVSLLETLASRIISKLSAGFPAIENMAVTVRKINPPLGGKCKAAEVVIHK